MTNPTPQDSPARSAEGLTANLGAYIYEVFNALDKWIRHEAAPYNISSVEYNLLWYCLWGEHTATQLAQVLPIEGSRISRVVAGLVDRGYLRRRRLRTDRRIVMLSLTEEGQELTSRIFQEMQRHYAAFMEGIGEKDLLVFESVISGIIANYKRSQAAE